ncbi:MAG: MltA domain-containing protein [Deltaproteobacteria bacterium]|nr:MltA domain-containing protein [Deltaproteobacteria bacterium]MBW1719129.1 MltA domain-containing protein [Deltaproteobacteria bacterium]MBW1932458.1 MltA domain-containing protein [Deltaproteobacteria bacterium]MBW1939417.1 MltA domain-containing protein [Deltaproteobacteria bacterium]MBW1964487.1 MltA domain-containing protein [Deltaproteobacteria bacterium]
MVLKRTVFLWIFLIGLIGALGGLVVLYRLFWLPAPPVPLIEQVPIEQLPAFEDIKDKKGLQKSISASLEYLEGHKDEKQIPWDNESITIGTLKKTLRAFSGLLDQNFPQEDLQREIRRLFIVYRITGGEKGKRSAGPLLVTGYFQPELPASLKADEEFVYPLYETPQDLIRITLNDFDSSLPRKTLWGRISGQSLIPYYTRADIDNGRKLKCAGVLAWLRSPVDGLMLHIQGSGVLRFQDESRRYIHYASSNGHPYYSIGQWLIDEELLYKDQADWPGIRAWAQKNPEEFRKAFDANPRYIFFKWEKEGPIGALGEVLTPMRSVALDHKIYPPGALCFLQVPMPVSLSIQKGIEFFQGFVCNQDTGSAIKGPHRLDLYCGEDDEAGYIAGRLKATGSLYLLLLRDAVQEICLSQP